MRWTRGKFSTAVSGAIIGFIAFVFVVSGVFSPRSTRGLHEGAVAGTVNGEAISLSEYNRSLNQRMEMLKGMMGGKVTDEQLKQFRVREGVFQELVRRKVLIQEAMQHGLAASDEEVQSRIREVPAFQKEGKFDLNVYKGTLEANHYVPANFEQMIRDDLSVQGWQSYFMNRVKVADAELKKFFETSENTRTIQFVLLSADGVKKTLKADATFEEIRKVSEQAATEVLAGAGMDKRAEAKINALVKKYGASVKSTGAVSRDATFLPELGEAAELMKDAFAQPSTLEMKQGGKAKKYSLARGVVVAWVSESRTPDWAKFESSRSSLLKQVAMRKQRELFESSVRKWMSEAKTDANPNVMGDAS